MNTPALPRLSVIVPNYNHGAYLPRCLDALFHQSVQPVEVIVVDDASTDNSVEILERYARQQPKLQVHRNATNQGVVYGMNRGLDLAQGDYVFFVGADDEVKSGIFEKSLSLLAAHPQAALCCTISEWHDAGSGLTWHMGDGMASRPCYLSPGELVQLGRRGKLIICTSSAILKKEPLAGAGRFLPELRWHCDWFATLVPALRHGLCHVPEPLSDFYLHPDSYYNKGRRSREHFEVLDRLLEKLSSKACADIAPRVRDSAALALFGVPVLRLLVRRSQYRQFLTPRLVLRAARRSAELLGKRILPRPLARLCLRWLYHHHPASAENSSL